MRKGEEGAPSKRRHEGSSVYYTRAGGRLCVEFEGCTLLFHHHGRREEAHGGVEGQGRVSLSFVSIIAHFQSHTTLIDSPAPTQACSSSSSPSTPQPTAVPPPTPTTHPSPG